MPGRSMFREMDADPFFAGYTEQMRRMDEVLREPFGRSGMLENGQGRERKRDKDASDELLPFGAGFGFSFGNILERMDMMRDTERAFARNANDENGCSFQQSSFMSYNKSGEGPPKVFQASSSTKRGPGYVKETRKALRDSEKDLEKMAIGHHIKDRGHEVERRKNTRSGTTDESNNFFHLGENDAEAFDHEWKEKSRQAFRGLDFAEPSNGRSRAIDYDRRRDYDDRPRGERREDYDERRREGRREDHRQLALPEPEQRELPGAGSVHWGRSSDGRRKDRQ